MQLITFVIKILLFFKSQKLARRKKRYFTFEDSRYPPVVYFEKSLCSLFWSIQTTLKFHLSLQEVPARTLLNRKEEQRIFYSQVKLK